MDRVDTAFVGAKVALFVGEDLALLRRDDRPDVAWPGYLDFPGGGREGAETPAACVIRETQEELGVVLRPSDLHWARGFVRADGARAWFFAAHVPAVRAQDIRLGDEGQAWLLMRPADYLADPKGIAHFKDRLRLYLSGRPAPKG